MADKEDKKDEQLTIVGPGADEELLNSETSDEESIDEGSEDTRLGHSETDDEEEESSTISRKPYHEMTVEEKRQWRKDKKNRQRTARQRDQTELNFLRTRNENLERRFSQLENRTSQTEVLGIDQRISQLKSQVSVADQVIAEAVKSASGDEMVEAQRIREDLLRGIHQLENLKGQFSASKETSTEVTTQTTPRRVAVPPEVTRLAGEFQRRHPWFKQGQDEDSDIVSTIDNRVMADGFDPTTSEYWDELEDRMKKRLPHRFKSSKSTELETPVPKKRSGGPAFSTRGGERRPLKRGEVFISEGRKQAMIEAGVWDDPVLKARYLKSFQKYDQEAANRTNA